MIRSLFKTLELIKFSHTIFALPFALISMLLAAQGFPPLSVFVSILICMVGARTAAMSFNRYLDWEIDQRNERTWIRSTLGSKKGAGVLTLGGLIVFAFGLLALNPLCWALSPLALLLILGYSALKRWTFLCHLGLGLALAAAPMGAWAAVRGELWSVTPWILSAGVLCWVFGFDLIYATQDAEFDRKEGLYSIPARFGIATSLRIARGLHAMTFLFWILLGQSAKLGGEYHFSLALVGAGLLYEHWISRDTADLQKINRAFFIVNGLIGIVLFAGVGFSFY